MAITSFCTSCQRTVYLEEEDTHVCPVCSTPLLQVVPKSDEPSDESETTQAEGAK